MITIPNSQQHLGRKVGLSLLVGTTAWIVLLIAASSGLSGNATGMRSVHFGPLDLNHLTKIPADGGYSVSISFEQGLLWYVLFWIMLGVVWALLPTSRRKP